jgi:hypothetical protein
MNSFSRGLFAAMTIFAGILLLSMTPVLADHDHGKGKGHEDTDEDDDDRGPNRRNFFRVELSGREEVPAISTTGEGLLTLRVDGNTITYELEYNNLKGGTPTAVHIHLGQRGVVGGVIAFLCGGGGKPACPAQGVKLMGMLQGSDVVGPAAQGLAPGNMAAALAAMRGGLVYANAHNPAYPGGEIRGQLR